MRRPISLACIAYSGRCECIVLVRFSRPGADSRPPPLFRIYSFGAVTAATAYTLFHKTPAILAVFGFFFSMPCFYYIVAKPQYATTGRFVLLTYNLTCLFSCAHFSFVFDRLERRTMTIWTPPFFCVTGTTRDSLTYPSSILRFIAQPPSPSASSGPALSRGFGGRPRRGGS